MPGQVIAVSSKRDALRVGGSLRVHQIQLDAGDLIRRACHWKSGFQGKHSAQAGCRKPGVEAVGRVNRNRAR